MNKRKLLFLSAFLLFICINLQSQSGMVAQIKYYLPSDGLAAKQVNAIAADRQGALWIATSQGLNRFDGHTFAHWTTKEGLGSNQISQLYMDAGRFLWLVYGEEKRTGRSCLPLEVFDIMAGRVVPVQQCLPESLPFDLTQVDTFFIKNNTLVFGVSGGSWWLFERGKGFRYTRHLRPTERWLVVDSHTILTLSEEAGQHWINLRKATGLLQRRLKLPGGQYIGQPHFLRQEGTVVILLLRRKDRPTALSWLEADLQSGLVSVCMTVEVPAALASPQDWQYIPGINAYWAGVSSMGLLISQQGDALYQADIARGKMVNTNRQHLLIGNTLWHCSDEGFYQFSFFINRFRYVFADLWPRWNCRSIQKWNGKYLFGSPAGSLIKESLEERGFQETGQYGLSSLVDTQGRWWMAASNKLVAYDLISGQSKEYFVQDANEPWSMYLDQTGRLWMSQKGLFQYNPNTQQQKNVDYGSYTMLKNHVVYHFHPLQPDSMLLLTTAGIFGFVPEKGITSRYWSGGKGAWQLPSNDFRHLYYETGSQIYWLATGDKGLLRWDPQKKDCQVFSFEKGLASVVHAVYPDDYGHLWMSTEGGIVQFDTLSHRYKIYTTQDGLLSDEFNRISHFKDDDGKLVFGSVNGVVVIDPSLFKDELKQQYFVQPVVIEMFKYDNDSERLENRTALLYEEQRLSMRPGERFISLRLALQDARWNNRATRFYYRIRGLDDNWIALEGNELVLNKIPYGQQLLQVKAVLSNGLASATVLNLPVRVYRPFYLTGWFIGLCIAVVGVVFYALYRMQIRYYRQQQRLRTQIAADLYEDVGAMLARMAMQSEMATYVSPERSMPMLGEILDTSRVTLDTMRDLIWSIDARYDSCSDMLLRMEEQLEEVLVPAGIAYSFDAKYAKPELPIFPQLRREVFFIFKEALDNSVKLGQPQSISILLSYNGEVLQLRMQERYVPGQLLDEATIRGKQDAFHRASQRAARLQASLQIELSNQGYLLQLLKK